MERLTERKSNMVLIRGCRTVYGSKERAGTPLGSAIARLADYEDTGRTSEEVIGALTQLESYKKQGLEPYDYAVMRSAMDDAEEARKQLSEALGYIGCHGLDHLRELVNAEKEGNPPVLPPNDPLTVDELHEMGGEPYYHVGLQDDSPAPHWAILDPFYAKRIEHYGYGERWIAYRRKPDTTDKENT